MTIKQHSTLENLEMWRVRKAIEETKKEMYPKETVKIIDEYRKEREKQITQLQEEIKITNDMHEDTIWALKSTTKRLTEENKELKKKTNELIERNQELFEQRNRSTKSEQDRIFKLIDKLKIQKGKDSFPMTTHYGYTLLKQKLKEEK